MKTKNILGNAFFVIIFTVIVVSPISAQTEVPLWFWAWRSYDLEVELSEDQRGDLLAFTPDGTINILLEDVFPIVLQRIDDAHAFVGGRIDDTYSLYYLTSTQAILVTELFEQSYIDEFRNTALYDGYTYFIPQIILAGENRYLIADTKRDQYAIFDAAQNSITRFNLRAWCQDDCVRVSEDGRYIRYRVSPADPMHSSTFHDPNEDALPYQLYEYDVVNETERLIFEKEAIETPERSTPPRADCTPDRYGDRWYCELFLDDGDEIWMADEKIIVYANGSIAPVHPDWRLRVFDNRWYFLDLDRRWHEECMPCVINVFPEGNEAEAFQFDVPLEEVFSFWYPDVKMLSEQHLLPNPTGQPMYALSRSGELTELGNRACCADPTSLDFYDRERGLMVLINRDEAEILHTEIWNTRPLERLASVSVNIQPGVRSTFRDYSLVLFGDRPGGTPAVAYSYIDEILYEFEFTEYLGYIDAFSGGVLLADYGAEYSLYSPYTGANDGIYRWTPSEGETLLIDGAVPIPDRVG